MENKKILRKTVPVDDDEKITCNDQVVSNMPNTF